MEETTIEEPEKPQAPAHPIHYTIFKPNSLIHADRSELKGMEISVYNEILNHNHKDNPDVVIYRVPYELVLNNPSKNGSRDRQRIGQALQSRSIYLSKEDVKKYLGEKAPRSISPFTDVVYHDKEFEIWVNPVLKKILSKLDAGFTKGDIETLRGFRHDISNAFYWIARQRQAFRHVWKMELQEFKELLNIEDRHKDWRNFKRKVLDPIQEDMKGTWVEFHLELVKKGKGGAVSELIFKFKKGPKDEADSPAGSGFQWEAVLVKMGVDERIIKQLRQHVKAGSTSETDNGTWVWDSHYMEFSIEAARKQYNKQKKGGNPIKNLAAWFVTGIHEGRWLEYVEKERAAIREFSQGRLFESSK